MDQLFSFGRLRLDYLMMSSRFLTWRKRPLIIGIVQEQGSDPSVSSVIWEISAQKSREKET